MINKAAQHKCVVLSVTALLLFNFSYAQDIRENDSRNLSYAVIASIYDVTNENLAGEKQAVLNMARNEHEGFQLRLSAQDDAEQFQISADTSVPLPFEVEIFELGLFQGQVDVLVPHNPDRKIEISGGQHKHFFIRVYAPEECMPGEYYFNLEIAGRHKITVPVSVTVHNVLIPEQTTIPYVFGIFDRAIYGRYRLEPGSDLSNMALMQHYRMLQEYKLSPFFCDWISEEEPIVMHHAYPSPFPLTDERTLALLREEKLAAFALPFHSVSTSPDLEHMFHTPATKEELLKVYEFLKQNGLDDKAYFYIFDEPHSPEHYPVLKNWAQELYKLIPEAKVLTTYFSGPDKSRDTIMQVPEMLGQHTQIHCLSYWATKNSEKILQEFFEEVKRIDQDNQLWMYTTRIGFDIPGVNQRSLPWKMFKDGVKGYLYWAANPYVLKNTPYEEPETFVLDGQGFELVLPRENYLEEEKDTFIRPQYLSFNKKATATGDSSPGHGPEYAVNGDWSHPKAGWWGHGALKVDLEKIEEITSMQVVPYHRGNRAYRYFIEISSDGQKWQEVVDMSENTKSSDRNGFVHEFDSIKNARFVRLNVLGSNLNRGAHICEFIIRGLETIEKAEDKYDQNTDFTPLPSIRLERFRDGVEDYELLQLYTEQKGRDKAVELLSNIYSAPDRHTDSFSDIEKMRKIIFKQLSN